jgi:hypothetical protein
MAEQKVPEQKMPEQKVTERKMPEACYRKCQNWKIAELENDRIRKWHFLLHASGIFYSGIFCSGTFQNLKFGHFLFGHKVETQWKHNASRKIA